MTSRIVNECVKITGTTVIPSVLCSVMEKTSEVQQSDVKRQKYELKTPQFGLKAILPDEYSAEVSLTQVYVSRLEHKQQISEVMRELSQLMPMIKLQHLKRVNQQDIIVCEMSPEVEQKTLRNYLIEHKVTPAIVAILCRQTHTAEVPVRALRLRWQYEAMQHHWPCKFHPDKYLEALHNGSNFSAAQKEYHLLIASLVWRLSNEVELKQPTGLCIDPRTQSIVAVAASRPHVNPMMHCVMLLIDLVARTQSGGAWRKQLNYTIPADATEGVTLAGIPKHCYDYIQAHTAYKHLRLGAERLMGEREKVPPADEVSAAAGLDNLAKYGPYLGTGYDVYLSQEPCLMCAMALVHSRVKRVFFLQTSENGALLTSFKLHGVKELNHHYDVFQFIDPAGDGT